MPPLLLAVLALAVTEGGPERVPNLAVDVLNSAQVRRSILHFEDVIGPKARTVGPNVPARAVLVVSVPLDQCKTCEEDFDALSAALEKARPLGGMIVVLVMTRPQGAARARAQYVGSARPFPIALDAWGIAQRRLGIQSPGQHLVIRSDGRIAERFGPGRDALERALRAFTDALEAKEDL